MQLATPIVKFPYGDDFAVVIFPMGADEADDLKCLIRTLICDCVLDRGWYDGEEDYYVSAEYNGVNITAGVVECRDACHDTWHGLRLDLHSWEPSDLDYTQAPTELCLDARLAAAAAVRVILAAIDC